MRTRQAKNIRINSAARHGFASGLIVGSLFGAAAYFLYGTPKGNELKNQFLAEYERAHAELSPSLLRTHSDSNEVEVQERAAANPAMTGNVWARFRRWIAASFESSRVSEEEEVATSEKRRYFRRRNS